MRVLVEGSGGSAGWPQPGCRCASCLRQAAAGNARGRSAVVVDGRLRLGAGEPAGVPGYRVRRLGDAGWDVTAPDGGRLLYPAGPGAAPAPPEGSAPYDVAFLDLLGDPAQLGWLRARGLITAGTVTAVAFADHRVPSEAELARRCGFWRVRLAGDGEAIDPARSVPNDRNFPAATRRVLVLGGARSGKSERAELRLAGEPEVTYVATGNRGAADPDWAARVAAHRARRPAWWRTAETTDLAGLLGTARGALLIDGIGTWLAAVLDECGWDLVDERGAGKAGRPDRRTGRRVAAGPRVRRRGERRDRARRGARDPRRAAVPGRARAAEPGAGGRVGGGRTGRGRARPAPRGIAKNPVMNRAG